MSGLFEVIKNTEKIELHRHMDGSMTPEEILTTANKNNIELKHPSSKEDLDTVDKIVSMWNDWKNITIIDKFAIANSVLQSPDELYNFGYNEAKKIAAANIVYCETRFAPQNHTSKDLSYKKIIKNVIAGLNDGAKETNSVVKLIISINRESEIKEMKKVIRAASKYKKQGVVGIDFAFYEKANDVRRLYRAAVLTHKKHIPMTMHAGEMVENENKSINNVGNSVNLGVYGLAHAIHLWKDKSLYKIMISNRIRLESQPRANIALGLINGYEDLHLDQMINDGLAVTLNSDDPTMWERGSLSEVFYDFLEAYKDVELLKKMQLNAINYSFGLSKDEKKGFIERIESQELYKGI
ncbi:MAG: hypothetical protein ABIB43_02145 [archaeon]